MTIDIDTPTDLDLVWGAQSISRIIDRSPRQTFHLLESGHIPARKIGGQWVASRTKLREFFDMDSVGPAKAGG